MTSTDFAVDAETLTTFVEAIFAVAGSNASEAGAVAERLVEANLMGHDSHGVARVIRYVEYLANGDMQTNQSPTVVSDLGGLMAVDGNSGFGQSIGRDTMELAIARAAETGMVLLALRNVGHLGRIGAWAEQAAAAGLVSIHFVNTTGLGMLVAPFGGSDARLSTNPIAIGVPRAGEEPIIFDAATSSVAEGKVFVAANKGVQVPEGSLLNNQGQPTRDPQDLYTDPRGAITAFGLHKGSGLCFMTDLLAGVLTGGGCTSPGVTRLQNNMLSILVRPENLATEEFVTAEVARFAEWVKSSPCLEPDGEVLLPGEPERQSRARRLADGVPLDQTTYGSLLEAARQVGIIDPVLATMPAGSG